MVQAYCLLHKVKLDINLQIKFFGYYFNTFKAKSLKSMVQQQHGEKMMFFNLVYERNDIFEFSLREK